MTTENNYIYKYLYREGKSRVNGLHEALSEVNILATDDDTIKDALDTTLQYDTEGLNIDEDMFEVAEDDIYGFTERDLAIAKLTIRTIQSLIASTITDTIISEIDNDNDFDAHKAEIDKSNEDLPLAQNQILYDDEGYYTGIIKSVGEHESVVVLGDFLGDNKSEVTMPNREIRTFTIYKARPSMVEYLDGKKIEHYIYGEPVESNLLPFEKG